ncbi:hydrocephalus-inducing protein homolog isoform X3 [Nasonia vitripennis]|uniref:HYDIN/VesB/CFA65-like Ig-like domain-containing protein n=1 Tax=Nasonia vitripennis TaxID=7425 RepID=A0A7M7QE98_NASVI|nr:hydrocephalus-inducing protein homolog isoform X3 [Nasonia vitripennis]
MDCECQPDETVSLKRQRSRGKDAMDVKNREKDDVKNMATYSPSEYIQKMTLNPESISCNIDKYREMESNIFTSSPRIVVFSKFEIGNVYRISLSICNTSQYPHYIKLLKSDDVSFNVVFKGSTLNARLAPGMALVYDVEFRPDEKRDYSHDITFTTDTETFIVPVIAIGPRALLSFPDDLDMERTAVKISKTKPVLLQNIGDGSTGFSIFPNNPSFTIMPSKGYLEIGEVQQVQINFTPLNTGISNGYIFLRYERGDIVRTVIYGEAEKCDVRVLNEHVEIENTFLGLSRQVSIEIQNNSDYILSYEWLRYKSIEIDLKERERCKNAIDPAKSLFLSDAISQSTRTLISHRIYSDKAEHLKHASFAFADTHFSLFAMKGEIWPRNSTNVIVTFTPKEVKNHLAVAYLEMKGLENRIAVSLAGKCIGPALELNLLSLDVQQVYLCSDYNYEIVCKNNGPIPGTLQHVQKDACFGSKITVEPSEVEIHIDKLKSMNLSFCSDRTGNFVERVDFVIKESSEVLSFVIKGTVICPLVRVDDVKIDFHTASIGFTTQKQLCFRNLSHTPIDFNVRVIDDGYEDPMTHEEFARTQTKPEFPTCPREFLISPSEGTVKPQKVIRIRLFYTPNVVRSEDVLIQICLCRSPNAEPLLIPVYCRAKTAAFEIDPPEINILSCFINFQYFKNLVIKNSSDVDGYFYIVPQEVDMCTRVLYSLSTYQGYLKSGESKEIILTVIVKTVGQQEITLRLLSLGLETQSPCCKVICSGQGPLVSVEPSQLHWGEVQLLQKKYLTLELINDSPISAEFTSAFSKNKSVWEVEPVSGQLEANESITLNIYILLRDKGKYFDHLYINILNGEKIDVSLSAIGIGTCIVFDPEILPEFNMGFLFSKQDINLPLTIKNEGNKHHYVLLTNVEKVRQGKNLTEEMDSRKFKIEPNIIELQPGLEKVLQCKIRWNVNESVSERWYIYATIDGKGKRELVGTSMFKATFIKPNVIFSKNELSFRLDIGYNHEMLQQEDELQITNQSGRSLNALLTIEPPFFIIDKCNCCTDNLDITLNNDDLFTLKVCFPFDIENSELLPQKYDGYIRIEYDEHKQIDTILCKAEVNFPHLVFIPSDINFYCVAGYSDEKRVKVINDSPLPVFYKIKWIKESFAYESLSPVSEKGSEELTRDENYLDNSISSISLPKYNNKPNIFDIMKMNHRNSSDIDESSKSCDTDNCECAEGESEKSSFQHSIFSIELLDRFLQITPEEGQISPYTEQSIYFSFNGYENMKMSVQAICEITCGSSQLLNVTATADIVRCQVEDYKLDYGLQLYCETSVRALKVMNQCMIPLSWSIEASTDLLQVMEAPQMLEPVSENLILIDRKPSAPGLYNEKLFLEVTNLEPFVIEAKWLATIPQIYLDVSRNDAFDKYPVEFGYNAVQLVMAEGSLHAEEPTRADCFSCDSVHDNTEFTDYEKLQLTDDNWYIIAKDENYPSQVDIDMAFERVIFRDHMQMNEDGLITSNIHANNERKSYLYAPSYVVNMGFVVVDQTTQISIPLRNYGYEKAKVKLKRDEKKKKVTKSCFYVQFQQNVEICQCENSTLNVIFSPKKDMFSQKRTDVSHKFYLEVKYGLTIPVHIEAAAVYPYVTVDVETLNFEKVFIGDCREMSFRLKNNALVGCQWKLFIEDTSKIPAKFAEMFYVKNVTGDLIPDEETIVKVYFKPYRNSIQARILIINVLNTSQESKSIKLIGCGLERKLKINKMNVKFPPVLPNAVLEEDLAIENNNVYPIEVYWQHLTNFSEINMIIRVLKHYYKKDEILVPQKRTNESILSPILTDFYKNLIYEMSLDNEFKNLIKTDFFLSEILDTPKTENESRVKKAKKGESIRNLNKSSNKLDLTKPNNAKVAFAFSDIDPNEIEKLLHGYINKLQKDLNFFETMKDPLTDVYEATDRETAINTTDTDTSKVEKSLIIIFHGAPYTEYQETACQSAKMLNLPLLNLNQIFLGALAVLQSESAKKLAGQIENRYNELTAKLEKLKNAAVVSNKQTTNVYDKVVQVLKKLPPREKVERMDMYTNYEHKVETIILILSVIESLDSSATSKGKSKTNTKNTTGKSIILPGVSHDLFRDILRDCMSQLKFKNGYVLQTLNNEFIKNEAIILNMLLEATGKSKFYLFITFYNSYELYERRYEKLHQTNESNHEMIQTLGSSNEIVDVKSDQEKPKLSKKSKKISKRSSFLETSVPVTDMNLEEPAFAKEIQSTTIRKTRCIIPESDQIMKKMKDYHNNLSTLLAVINEWESGMLKVKDKNFKETTQIRINDSSRDTFFVWHIHSDDPWDKKIYQATNLQIISNFKDIALYASSTDKLSVPLLPSRTYTILKEYDQALSKSLTNQNFILLPQTTEPATELSKKSSETSILQLPNTEIRQNLEVQMILQPRESRKFKLKFSPMEVGQFKEEFVLGLIDNADTIFKIKVEGIADIPKLYMTPDFVFDKVKSTKVNDPNEPTYFLDTRICDFGNILISNTVKRIHKKVTNIRLKNISAVPAMVSLTLENENFEDFDIHPWEITIQPNKIESFEVAAYASKLGVIDDNLIVSIENSEYEQIRLQSNGVELKVEVDPRQINLDRVLLYRTEKRNLTIRNVSEIPINWRLSAEHTNSRIRLSSTAGKIKTKSSCEIELQYYADKVIPTHTKFIICEIFLNEKDQDPIETYNITVTAQNYELLFEIIAKNPIYFDAIPVGSINNVSFAIKNLGAYDIRYEIQFQDKEILKKLCDAKTLAILEQDFKIQPTAGLIQTKKQTTINITYAPTIETTLKSFPLFECEIIEPYRDVGLVNKCIVNVSATSYYTRFFIEPQPQLNFGSLALKMQKTMQIKIENTGKFPLKFLIVNQSTLRTPQTISVQKRDSRLVKKDKRSPKKEKIIARQSTNISNYATKWGPFTLEKTQGDLKPGQSDILTVNCWSDAIGYFEEKATFLIADSSPSEEHKREVSMVVDICVAEIIFKDYNEIFPDSYVVESLEDSDYPNKIDAHTIFETLSKCLHFYRVCIGNIHTISITLRNTNVVPGNVIIETTSNSTFKNMFMTNTNKLTIPPMSKQSFVLSFTPTVLGNFSSLLTMKLDLPSDLEPRIFTINLHGESYVPQIRLIDPATENNDISMLDFGLTILSDVHEKVIKIKNAGQIAATITVKIFDDLHAVYGIAIDQNKNKWPCGCSNDENGSQEVTLQLFPGEVANIRIRFVPIAPKKYKSCLKIIIENNPYEILEVNLMGEGLDTSIVLENLEFINSAILKNVTKTDSRESSHKLRKKSSKHSISVSRSTSKILTTQLLSYKLDYGTCFLNRMSKINFKIRNKTEDRYFKFEWSSHQNLVCLPAAGHLAPNSFKEMTAMFLAWEPLSLSQVLLECIVCEIAFNNPPVEPSWDSRQTNVNWIEKNPSLEEYVTFEQEDIFVRKIVAQTLEPEFQVVPETTQSIQLLVSAVADYSDYFCNVEIINFDDTLMLQSKEYKFTLKNIGLVNLDYSWELTMDEHYPIRLDSVTVDSTSSIKLGSNEKSDSANEIPTISYRESKQRLQIKSKNFEESYEPSDLFSSSAGLTDRSTDSWIEGENWPFEVTPKTGSLRPNEVVECTLKFLPVDVFEYKAYLRCKIENLNPNKAVPNIVITAKSLLPYCHFEIEDSDYLTKDRRDITLPGPPGYSLVDPETRNNIRVVEFKMMGTRKCHTRSIYLINPTCEDYCYCWSSLSNHMQNQPIFQCLPQTGLAEKGKRCKISFSHIAEKNGLFESFWQFEIKKYNLKTLFLIVTNVIEPSIECLTKIIKMEPSALGESKISTFEIINKEDCPLHFDILPDSLYSENGRLQTVSVCPMSGILQPHSAQTFNVEYKSSLIGEHSFDLQCKIENLSKLLKIFINVQVVKLSSKLIYIDDDDKEIEMIESCDNFINIGQLFLREPNKIKFKIINNGQLDFDYSWTLKNPYYDKCKIAFSEDNGTVEHNSINTCYIEMIFLEKTNTCNYSTILNIKYGLTYRLKLNISSKKLPMEFSFSRYDFGPCYIQTQRGYYYTTELNIKNNQKLPCSIKCNFEDKPHLKLDLSQLPYTIPANDSCKIIINFQPMEETVYKDKIPLLIKEITQKEILIQGEGVPYKIRLKDPREALIDFGTITVGKSSSRKIHLLNEGRLPAKVKVILKKYSLENTREIEEQFKKDIETNYLQPHNSFSTHLSSDYQTVSNTMKSSEIAEFIEILPATLRDLKPNKEMEVTIKCRAIKRIQSLAASLGLVVDNFSFHLALVKANCVKANLYLSRTYISFGTIFEGCTTQEKLVLINDGDISMGFIWETEKIKPHFEITPVSGYCSAGSEITFTCTFKPSYPTSCIKSEATLEIQKHKNVTLTITGDCRRIPESTNIIAFTAEIGQSKVKQIEIQNDSDRPWTLTPLLLGEHFTTDRNLFIDSKTNSLFSITYKPLQKSVRKHIDKGKLIIVLPDGRQPIVYDLSGIPSAAAEASEKRTRKIPAKRKFVETFVVYNNSNKQQTFNCRVEELLYDKSIITHKLDQIDVNSNSRSSYEYSFLFDSEGRYIYKVTMDDSNGNIRFYDLEFTVTIPEIAKIIKLTTYVRCPVLYNLKIENPSKLKEAKYDINNNNEDIIVHGLPTTLAPSTFVNVQIEYLPLIACETNTILEITTEVFGSTFYELHLTAKAMPPEKTTHVKSVLGSSVNFGLRLKNYSRRPCQFDISVDKTALSCSKSISIPPNQTYAIEARFEPDCLETINATIVATSLTAGEFVFPIVGLCTPPQPRGPFEITTKSPTILSFKNVFNEKKAFEFTVDNPNFAINSSAATIESKEEENILVSLQDTPRSRNSVIAGKLTITSTDESLSGVKWIYYLKGVIANE